MYWQLEAKQEELLHVAPGSEDKEEELGKELLCCLWEDDQASKDAEDDEENLKDIREGGVHCRGGGDGVDESGVGEGGGGYRGHGNGDRRNCSYRRGM